MIIISIVKLYKYKYLIYIYVCAYIYKQAGIPNMVMS